MNELISRELFAEQVRTLEALCALRGWTLLKAEYPVIEAVFAGEGRHPLRVHITAKNWNEDPPAFALLNEDGSDLPINCVNRLPGGVLNNAAHPVTGKVFVCTPGSRDYHTHSSHLTDLWDNHRNRPEMNINYVLTQMWRCWERTHR